MKQLSKRQCAILIGAAQGLSNKGIASILGISHHTVKNHFTSILDRLEAEDRTHAVVIAHCMGQLDLDCKKEEN